MSKRFGISGRKKKTAAKARWRMLARSVLKTNRGNNIERQFEENELSVRRFKGFSFLVYEKKDEDCDGTWYSIKNSELIGDKSIKIRLLHLKIDPDVLIGFNNTGNICIWPSEEILAIYCLKNENKFRGKSICELGGGMAAIAGLLLALQVDADNVLLTDGNKESSMNIQEIVKVNQNLFRSKCVAARQLVWGQTQHEGEVSPYDFVICADCLYFIEYQEQLIETIFNLLNTEGEAILFAPRRGTTFDSFMNLVQNSFYVTVIENYDEEVWQKHLTYKKSNPAYDPDIHYPLQLILRKKGR